VPKIRALCKKLKRRGGGRFYSRMEKEKIGFVRKICDLKSLLYNYAFKIFITEILIKG
jgi:hypothetical protein